MAVIMFNPGRIATIRIASGAAISDVLDLGGTTQNVPIVSERLVKGVAGGKDQLRQDRLPIASIVSVIQGGTTYTRTTDYLLTTHCVDWTTAGAEPAVGSYYDVVYTYTKEATAKAYRRWDVTIKALSPVLTGTVKVDVADSPTGTFATLQSGGADITIPAGKATPISPLVDRALRLFSASTEAADRDFVVRGVAFRW